MISLTSESYPYWAIHQNYGRPYAEVIEYLDSIPPETDRRPCVQGLDPWKAAVWLAWERQRR